MCTLCNAAARIGQKISLIRTAVDRATTFFDSAEVRFPVRRIDIEGQIGS